MILQKPHVIKACLNTLKAIDAWVLPHRSIDWFKWTDYQSAPYIIYGCAPAVRGLNFRKVEENIMNLYVYTVAIVKSVGHVPH